MNSLPWISVVIPTYGQVGVELTARCLNTFRLSHRHLNPQVIVVSDGEEGAEALEQVCAEFQAELLVQERGGFAKACNRGLEHSDGINTFLVNNDIEFFQPTLQMMASVMDVLNIGVAGCRLLYPNRTIQHAGVFFVPKPEKLDYPLPGWFDHFLRHEPEYHVGSVTIRDSLVTGALMGLSRWAIGTIGFLDERFGFSCEDIDYGLRSMECGRNPIYIGLAAAIHGEGRTRGSTPEEKARLAPDVAEREARSLAFLFEKWHGYNFDLLRVRME